MIEDTGDTEETDTEEIWYRGDDTEETDTEETDTDTDDTDTDDTDTEEPDPLDVDDDGITENDGDVMIQTPRFSQVLQMTLKMA